MFTGDASGLVLGAVVLGAIHGVEPGHGWPIAASYALDQPNKWLYGLAASFLLGFGHLVSSVAMVGAFFYAKSYFSLTQLNKPLTILGEIQLGGPVSLVAGVLLIGLGVREYRHGHAHSRSRSHEHHDADHSHSHSHSNENENENDDSTRHASPESIHGRSPVSVERIVSRVRNRLSVTEGHQHAYEHPDDVAERGLLGIAWFAFLLGFAHEEEFEIIALCAGSNYCLELMAVYALTVIIGIVGLTMLLIAGYHHYEEAVERYTPYLPAVSAGVLLIMGVGFILGLF